MSINELLTSELSYFQPMQERQLRTTIEQSVAWRLETIRQRQERIALEVYEMFNGTVGYGPFKGLKLNRNRWWGALDLGSQCLGQYEMEFLHVIRDIPKKKFSTFIDIGAADGYYAIGMLVTGKIEHCICFEQEDLGRKAILENWHQNGSVGRLDIYGKAEPKDILRLTNEVLERTLVIVDIEGAEFSLLTPAVLKHLKATTLLIEIHNWIDDFFEKYQYFLETASKHFKITILQNVERSTSHIKELRAFTDDNRALVVSERRPCLMRFLMLTPL